MHSSSYSQARGLLSEPARASQGGGGVGCRQLFVQRGCWPAKAVGGRWWWSRLQAALERRQASPHTASSHSREPQALPGNSHYAPSSGSLPLCSRGVGQRRWWVVSGGGVGCRQLLSRGRHPHIQPRLTAESLSHSQATPTTPLVAEACLCAAGVLASEGGG